MGNRMIPPSTEVRCLMACARVRGATVAAVAAAAAAVVVARWRWW